ncbi:MAG: S1 RNA-binding domain-containing protein, partial [Planctomycetota bacterium]
MASQATLDRLCAEFDSASEHILAAVELLEQNATPAYLSRYRRYAIGSLPEERLAAIAERLQALNELEQRRASVLEQAEERGRRTEELEQTLANTADQDLIDDYYQSMRPRRRGIAMQMEEKGLAPLALAIQHRQFGDAATTTVPAPTAAREDAAQPAAGDAASTPPVEPSAVEQAAEDSPAPDGAAEAPAEAQAGEPSADAPADESTSAAEPPLPAPAAPDAPDAPDAAGDAPGEAASSPAPATDAPPPEAAETPAEPLVEASGAAEAADAEPVPDVDLQKLAEPYVSSDNGLPTPEAALEGALLILADRILNDPATRARFRDELRRGILRAKPVNPDGDPGKYKQFFDFAEPINRIPANRMLALRRAEREKILRLELGLKRGRHREILRALHATDAVPGTQLGDFYDFVFDSAAKGLLEVCGNDVRRRLKEKADRESMRAFSRNLRSQLLAPPLGGKKVLSLRTSGKAIWAVVLNEDGSIGARKTMPTDNDEQRQGALELLVEWIKNEAPDAIAVPHGRRQAGSEKVVAKLREALGESPLPMVVPVDEAASTIFATSTGGKKAIPGVDVGVRTAISLGRRLQDPLLELARMEVRTLGLGQALDDVHQGTLQRELGRVKSSCIAEVGCDLNTAPAEVLQMIPGLGHERAQALAKHRKQKGGFQSRSEVAEVESINEACYRNIAAFLRLEGGSEPLDATPIHPDDYELVRAVATQRGCEPVELVGKNLRDVDADALVTDASPKPRVVSVLQQLQRADKDPRGELIATANEGVHTLDDLHQDRELKGRVASITDFGAFIDLGIGQDGLVHISQIPGHRMRDPNQTLRVGEVVTVWVLNVDQQKQKISLSMHKPRHLAEGRLPTLGERMEQQKGRRRGRGDRGARGPGAGDEAQSRRPGASGGRPGG